MRTKIKLRCYLSFAYFLTPHTMIPSRIFTPSAYDTGHFVLSINPWRGNHIYARTSRTYTLELL